MRVSDGVQAAIRIVERVSRTDNPIFDARNAHQFERSQLKVAGARVDGRLAVLFNRKTGYAVVAQKHRGTQSDKTAAHDKYRNRLLHGHDERFPLRCILPLRFTRLPVEHTFVMEVHQAGG